MTHKRNRKFGEIEWDEEKNLINKHQHEFSFEEAASSVLICVADYE